MLGLFVLVGVVVVAGHLGEGERFLALAEQAQPWWLALAGGLQAATYATDAGVWSRVLARAGLPRPFRQLYALSLVALFTNQAVPTAGVAGSVVVVRALERREVPRPIAVAVVLVDLVGYYAAYSVGIGLALAVAWSHHHLPPFVMGMAGAVVVLGVGISLAAVLVPHPDRRMPRLLRGLRPIRTVLVDLAAADPHLVRDPALLAQAFVLRGLNFVLDALTLWTCLRAVGAVEPLAPVGAAFVFASLARTLGVLPVGTFEAGAVGALALFGVAVEPALAATLLFRGLSFWLPMAPGLWLGRRQVRAAR